MDAHAKVVTEADVDGNDIALLRIQLNFTQSNASEPRIENVHYQLVSTIEQDHRSPILSL